MASAGDTYQVGQWWCIGANIASKATLPSVEDMASATGIYSMSSVEGMAFKADNAGGVTWVIHMARTTSKTNAKDMGSCTPK